MNILLLQTDVKWASPAYNRERARRLIEAATAAPGCPCCTGGHDAPDLIVLPEMFTTGFRTDSPEEAAETAERQTLEWLREIAGRTGAAVAEYRGK